jgi:hypothetical protein
MDLFGLLEVLYMFMSNFNSSLLLTYQGIIDIVVSSYTLGSSFTVNNKFKYFFNTFKFFIQGYFLVNIIFVTNLLFRFIIYFIMIFQIFIPSYSHHNWPQNPSCDLWSCSKDWGPLYVLFWSKKTYGCICS